MTVIYHLFVYSIRLDKEEEVLVKPEFEGLWNTKFMKYDADDLYSKKQKFPTCFKTKMEQVR